MRTETEIQNFTTAINQWALQAETSENRSEAGRRIIESYVENNTQLDLKRLGLKSLPLEIGYLASLRELNLSYNQLSDLPVKIGNLTSLDGLDISYNKLSTLPSEIGNLTSLNILNLTSNQLSTLPSEIGNLTSLNILHLGDNRFSALPAEIGNLTSLTRLNLANNQLSTLPEVIGNLTSLDKLYLGDNRFLTIPSEILNLRSLSELYLYGNQISTLPIEIGNLTSLNKLYLSDNQLTTIPDSILTSFRDLNQRVRIEASDNRFSPSEAERLGALVQGSGITLDISIHDRVQVSTQVEQAQTADILDKLINKPETEDKKQILREFLAKEELINFRRFLSECCTRTEGKHFKQEMMQALFEIVTKMQDSEVVKEKCKVLADTSFDTCGDRVTLAFAYMQLPHNLSDKEVKDFSRRELKDYAKDNFIISFLNEKAEIKIDEIKTNGGLLDEIETHLAYLQIAPDLGLELNAIQMLYQRCSNVSEADLSNAKEEFNSFDLNEKIAEYIYDDESIKAQHLDIKKLSGKISDQGKFSADSLKNETEQDYLTRIGNLQKLVKEEAISKIVNYLAGPNIRTHVEISEYDLEPDSDSEEIPNSEFSTRNAEAVKGKSNDKGNLK